MYDAPHAADQDCDCAQSVGYILGSMNVIWHLDYILGANAQCF